MKIPGFTLKCEKCGSDASFSHDIDYDLVKMQWISAARVSCPHAMCGNHVSSFQELTSRARQSKPEFAA